MVMAAKARGLSANMIAKIGPKLPTVKMFEVSRLSQRSNVSSPPALCRLTIVHISYALLAAASSTAYIVMHERSCSRQDRRMWS